ncbi:MAG: DNA repair protein RadC, partial [Chloroflexota bacterium]
MHIKLSADSANQDAPPDYRFLLRDLPDQEKPRERLLSNGAHALSVRELVAIILRTGSGGESVLSLADRLLHAFEDLKGISKASIEELKSVKGIGPAKAIELKAALELGRRLTTLNPADKLKVTSPGDAANLLMGEMANLEKEHLKAILLDTRNQVIRVETIYIGSLNAAAIRIGEVYRGAIKHMAAAIIIAHNHPSGDPSPSTEDTHVTRELVKAGRLLNIPLL